MNFRNIKTFLFGTLRGRLILSVAAVHAVMMTLFIIDLTVRQSEMLLDRQKDEAVALSQSLSTSASGWLAAYDISGLQEIVEAQSRYPELIYAILSDERGEILAHTDKSKNGQYLIDLPNEIKQTVISKTPELVDIATPALLAGRHVGWVRVGLGQKIAGNKLNKITNDGILYALAAILIGVIIAWFVGRRFTKRLYAIQDTISQVRTGNRTARSGIEGTDEAASMANEFNIMLDALDKQEAALAESEENYRLLLRNIKAAVVVHGPDTKILTSNFQAQELLGLTEEQMLGREAIDPAWNFFQEDRTIMPLEKYPVNQVIASRRSLRNFIIGVHRSDNENDIWALVNADPVFDKDNEIIQVIVTFVDVTERKQIEEELSRLNRELLAISNCNQVLMQAEDEQTLLNDVCRIVCDEAGYRLAWVGYVENDDAKSIRPVAWGGFDNGYVANAKLSWAEDVERAQGPGGTAIRSGKVVCIQDFTTDPRMTPWRESALQRGYRSAIALPLKDNDANVFGVFLIYSTKINSFTKEETRLLEELSGDLAFGITSLRLRMEHKQYEMELARLNRALRMLSDINEALIHVTDEEKLLNEVCRIVVDVGGYCMAWAAYPEYDEAKTLHSVAFAGVDSGYIKSANVSWGDNERGHRPGGTAIRTGKICVVRNIPTDPSFALWREAAMKRGYKSIIVLPLISEGQTLGILGIYSAEADVFDTKEVGILEELAGDLAFGINALRIRTERMLAEEQLIQSEERYRRITAGLTDYLYTVNVKNGKVVETIHNDACFVITGYTPKEFSEDSYLWIKMVVTEDMELVSNRISNLFEGKDISPIEHRIICKDGKIRWICDTAIPKYDSDGKLTSYDGVIKDITERKLAEEALQTTKLLLEQTIMQSPVPMVLVSMPDGIIRYVNSATRQFLCIDDETVLIDTPLMDLKPSWQDFDLQGKPGTLEELPLVRSLKGIKTEGEERCIIRKDGTIRYELVSGTPIFDNNGKVLAGYIIMMDITERKQAEEVLRINEERFRMAQAMGHVGNWEYNLQTTEFWGSDEAKRIYGFDPEQSNFTTDEVENRIPERKRVHQALVDLIEIGKPYNLEFEIHPGSFSEPRIIASVAELQRDKHGDPLKVVGVIQDITERKLSEEAIKKSEAQLNEAQRFARLGSWELDIVNDILKWSDEIYRIFEIDPMKFAASYEAFLEAIHPDDRETVNIAYTNSLKTRTPYAIDHRLLFADGRVKYVHEQCETFYDEQGKAFRSTGTVQDITERKLAEEALRRNEEALKEAQRLGRLGSWDWDAITDTITWSEEYYRIYGFDPSQQPPGYEEHLKTYTPDSAERLDTAVKKNMKTGEPYQLDLELANPNNHTRWITARSETKRDKKGQIIGLRGTAQDITERKLAEVERLVHLRFLESLNQVNRAIQGTNDLEQMMSDVLDVVISTFKCDRAFLMYPCDPGAATWKVPMERNKPEYPGVLELGLEMPVDADVAETFSILLESDGPVKFGPETPYPLPKYVSEKFGFKCFMSMAIHPKVGKPWQFGIHQCSHTRAWTSEEERLLQEIGRRLADALSNLLSHHHLLESEQRHRDIFDNVLDGLYLLEVTKDGCFRTIEVNPALEKLTGIPRSFSVGKTQEEIVPGEAADLVNAKYRRCVEAGRPVEEEVELDLPTGRHYFHSTLIPARNNAGSINRIIGISRDITESKRNNAINVSRMHLIQFAALHSLDELLEETLNEAEKLTGSLIGFYYLVDDDQKYLTLKNWSAKNKTQFCKAAGKDFQYAIDDAGVWVDCVFQRKPVIHNDYALLQNRKGMPEEHAKVTRELVVPIIWGEKIKAILGVGNKSVDYSEQDAEIILLLATFAWEIAERKQADEEILKLNKDLEKRVSERTEQLEAVNKELEAFSYSVSHDLQVPLRHISGFLEILQQHTADKLDDESRHYMNLILSSAKRMGFLILDLLSFSRMGRCEMTNISINLFTLVQEVIMELKVETAGRKVNWHITDLPAVKGDRSMLRIVMVNLISNALKFTKPCSQAEIEIGCKPGKGTEVVIFVRDNGVGFDMAYSDKLFGVFQRLHRIDEFEGTGIGLANVKRIIDRHGGKTWAEGKVDQGATFYFTISAEV